MLMKYNIFNCEVSQNLRYGLGNLTAENIPAQILIAHKQNISKVTLFFFTHSHTISQAQNIYDIHFLSPFFLNSRFLIWDPILVHCLYLYRCSTVWHSEYITKHCMCIILELNHYKKIKEGNGPCTYLLLQKQCSWYNLAA